MKKENWNQALSEIDADLVEEFVAKTEWIEKNNRHRRIVLRITALAACLCLIVGVLSNLPRRVPTWDDAMYSAEELAKMMNMPTKDGGATNAYTEVYVPNETFLKLNPIPDTEYLNIYEERETPLPLSKISFAGFLNGVLPKMAEALGETVPQYEIEKDEDFLTGEELQVSEEIGDISFSATQDDLQHKVSIYNNNFGEIVLNGKTVAIDQRMSDEEILNSLQDIKETLFDIFGVSFSEAQITREYNEYSETGATGISIYFFDSLFVGSAQNKCPSSDYIEINFENNKNYEGDIVSADILSHHCFIIYKTKRNDSSIRYEQIANAKMISLEDAEKLLYNGYVFGFHACPLCMANQAKVSFRNYDYVELVYRWSNDQKDKPDQLIPFYAFYKRIGTGENGNHIYAKTYVAAIEISGYKEYFQKQIKKHLS